MTFAIAASETQNVNVTVLPCFGLEEGSSITAKDMWTKMAQVRHNLFFFISCKVEEGTSLTEDHMVLKKNIYL